MTSSDKQNTREIASQSPPSTRVYAGTSRRNLLAGSAVTVLSSLVGPRLALGQGNEFGPPGWLDRVTGPGPTADAMTPAGLGCVKFSGVLHDRLAACIGNLTMAQNVERLIAPFINKADSGDQAWRCEFWGKWFDAAAMAYGYDPKPEYRAKLAEAVSKLIATQSPDGYIGTYNVQSELGTWDIWGRKYVLLGLLDYYDITGDRNVLTAAARTIDYLMSQVGPGRVNICNTGYGPWKGDPSCSILAMIVMLFERTGDKKYLHYAEYIVGQWSKPSKLAPQGMHLIESALAGAAPDKINAPKAYEMTSCFEGLCELYRVTGKREYLQACVKYAHGVIADEIMAHGSGSSGEVWAGCRRNQASVIRFSCETCVTETWMRYCLHLLQLTGDPLYAEQLEISLRNALLAALVPNGNWFSYFSALSGQRVPSYQQCTEADLMQASFAARQQTQQFDVPGNVVSSCCVCNGQRGLMMTPYWAVMTTADGIAVNLYNAGEAKMSLPSGKRLTLTQVTDYPLAGRIALTVEPEQAETFTLRMRIPSWSKRSSLAINGVPVGQPVIPGQYVRVQRQWRPGDKILLTLDMRGRVMTDPAGSSAIALFRGPLLLAMDNRLEAGKSATALKIEADANGYCEAQVQPALAKAHGVNLACAVPMRAADGSRHTITLCDYVSAGNGWSTQSLFRVWLPQPLNMATAWSALTPWQWLTYPNFRTQVPTRFITRWECAGPYRQTGKSYSELFDIPFGPEQAGNHVQWQPVVVPGATDSLNPFVVDLKKIFGGNNCVAYLRTTVRVRGAQSAMLAIGSDDGVKAWLNGKLVWQNNAARGLTPDQDKVKVQLRDGANTLLLKITQDINDWGACARFLPLPQDGEIMGYGEAVV